MNRIISFALILACALLAAWWSFGGGERSPAGATEDAGAAALADGAVGRIDPPVPGVADRIEIVARAEPVATGEPAAGEPGAGSLRVTVVYDDDGSPAGDVDVEARPSGGDALFDVRSARTDAAGVVVFEDLPPRRCFVESDRGDLNGGAFGTVEAGVIVDVGLRLAGGLQVVGIVVDEQGLPVAGAELVVAPWGGGRARSVGRSDAVGRFHLRAIGTHCHVGARAVGRAPSVMQQLTGSDGAEIELRIVLPGRGGAVEGVVFGPDGEAMAGAIVRVGADAGDSVTSFSDGTQGKGAMPVQLRTAADGTFVVRGLAPGAVPVGVRARGLAPWAGECEVTAFATTSVVVRLELGVTVTGVVREAESAPVAKAEVRVGDWGDFGSQRVFSDAVGQYRIDGLAPGPIELRADHDDFGDARTTLHAASGQAIGWDPVLSRGWVFRGRVLDDQGEPVERCMLEASLQDPGDGEHWFRFANTDDDGRFELTGCTPGRPIRIDVRRKSTFAELRLEDVMPGPNELEIRLGAEAWVHIRGVVFGPDGEPAEHVSVSPIRRGASSSPVESTEAGTGKLVLGPYPPGEYRVSLELAGLPRLVTPWRTLVADETWDLGVLRFARGGVVEVALEGDDLDGVRLAILDRTGAFVTRLERDGASAGSEPLLPGDYLLQIDGDEVRSREVPFSIRSDGTTRIEHRIVKATPVVLTLVPGLGAAAFRNARVEVFDGAGRAVLRRSAWRRDGVVTIAFGAEAGRYRVRATTDGGLRGGAEIAVAGTAVVEERLVLR